MPATTVQFLRGGQPVHRLGGGVSQGVGRQTVAGLVDEGYVTLDDETWEDRTDPRCNGGG